MCRQQNFCPYWVIALTRSELQLQLKSSSLGINSFHSVPSLQMCRRVAPEMHTGETVRGETRRNVDSEKDCLIKNRESVAQVRRNIVVSNDRTVACLYGRIDIDSTPVPQPSSRDTAAAVCKDCEHRFSRVTHMDSPGIAVAIQKLLSTVPDAPLSICINR